MLNNIAALYGVTVAGPTVTGGTPYSSGGYNYRVFTANGSLVVSGGSITADILVVAGGGGGGSAGSGRGGGGGAGGLIGFNSQSLSGTYSITIGAGAAASINASVGNGENSWRI
jgi:hypothetical protein